jgi:hypothetical protein
MLERTWIELNNLLSDLVTCDIPDMFCCCSFPACRNVLLELELEHEYVREWFALLVWRRDDLSASAWIIHKAVESMLNGISCNLRTGKGVEMGTQEREQYLRLEKVNGWGHTKLDR